MDREEGGSGPGDGCGKTCGSVEVPTGKEREALDALRRIKARVREIKAQLQGSSDKGALNKELEELREQWEAWRIRQEKAAEERMELLGHGKPDS